MLDVYSWGVAAEVGLRENNQPPLSYSLGGGYGSMDSIDDSNAQSECVAVVM